VPIGLAVDGANRHDMKLTRQTIESIPVPRPAATEEQPQGMCLDKGYDYDEVRALLEEFGFTAHIRARGEEAQAIKHGVNPINRTGVQVKSGLQFDDGRPQTRQAFGSLNWSAAASDCRRLR
jgi:putative transposase